MEARQQHLAQKVKAGVELLKFSILQFHYSEQFAMPYCTIFMDHEII
jgi:hypothetical protein